MSRELRRRRVSGRVTALALTVALGAGAVVVITSPIFRVRQIEIRGVDRLGELQVVRLSGISLGDNLLLSSLDQAEGRLLRSPWVAEATLERSLPDTLVVNIRERRPVAEVPDGQGAFTVVAADGVAVARSDRRDPALVDLPAAPPGLAVGGRLRGQDAVLRVAASFDRRLQGLMARLRLRGPEVEGTLADGGSVRYGRAESLPQKNAALLSMVRYARREGLAIDYVDVSTPTSPVLKPEGVRATRPPPEAGP